MENRYGTAIEADGNDIATMAALLACITGNNRQAYARVAVDGAAGTMTMSASGEGHRPTCAGATERRETARAAMTVRVDAPGAVDLSMTIPVAPLRALGGGVTMRWDDANERLWITQSPGVVLTLTSWHNDGSQPAPARSEAQSSLPLAEVATALGAAAVGKSVGIGFEYRPDHIVVGSYDIYYDRLLERGVDRHVKAVVDDVGRCGHRLAASGAGATVSAKFAKLLAAALRVGSSSTVTVAVDSTRCITLAWGKCWVTLPRGEYWSEQWAHFHSAFLSGTPGGAVSIAPYKSLHTIRVLKTSAGRWNVALTKTGGVSDYRVAGMNINVAEFLAGRGRLLTI